MLEFGLFGCLSTIGIAAGIGIAYWFITGQPKAQAKALQQKFVSMGDMRGKTKAQIEAVVGQPQSWAQLDGNTVTCSWNTTRYHITLQFKDDVCQGVTSEIMV